MKKLISITKPLAWFMALVFATVVTGCNSSSGTPAALSTTKALTAFSIAGASGTINESAKTIAVTLPSTTGSVTALVATFTSTGSSVKVGTTVQTSVTTANDFTAPVSYIVTAANSTTATYVVTVTVASATDKAMISYKLANVVASINETAKTIAVTLPSGTNVTAQVATFSTSGASVKVGSTVQTSVVTPNDFTSPVAYVVTAGDASTATYTVTVTVVSTSGPVAPVMGETARFVILASQAITTTGTTAIANGDLGILDQARTYYAGFTAGAGAGQYDQLTNGLSYAHDDTASALIPAPYASTIAFINQTRTDLGNAYDFLAADPNPGAATQVCPIELGALTLTKGVYKTAANVGITTGTLTLDAQGDANAVFIFTIDGTLTTGAPGGSIVLINGALAKNVYWRTGGATYIGAGTAFKGNVFAWTQINVLSGASVTGRLFGLTNQVTLIANTVTKAP